MQEGGLRLGCGGSERNGLVTPVILSSQYFFFRMGRYLRKQLQLYSSRKATSGSKRDAQRAGK